MRVPAIAPLEWQLKGHTQRCSGVTSDWSRGGMFIRTSHIECPGKLLELRINLGAAALRVDAMVMHTTAVGMGVKLDFTTSRVC